MPGRVRKVIGRLAPNELYTKEGAMRFGGLGPKALEEARAAGVKPIEHGRRLYYRGEELIEFITSKRKQERKQRNVSSLTEG